MDYEFLMCLFSCVIDHWGWWAGIIGASVVLDRMLIWSESGPRDLYGSFFVGLYRVCYYTVVIAKNLFVKK